ncbi:hypothetical protein Q1695_007157 [Nippostrongylus brasiliensis]|nr:hypothetical protein Q1695_007157 [Nippostrongylus brasiliensis]
MHFCRSLCNSEDGEPPLFVNVDARDGSTANTWVDALQASFAGLLVLAGQLDEAICQHAFYYAVWSKYGVLPERYNWFLKRPDVNFYPLRPEFVESTYLLYQATKNPFYLHVGREIMDSLNSRTRVKCGFATVHNVNDGSLEDRMESFFLAETMKYLYLLFDEKNPVNVHQERLLFTTEGHIVPVLQRFRDRSYVKDDDRDGELSKNSFAGVTSTPLLTGKVGTTRRTSDSYGRSVGNSSCETTEAFPRHVPPLGDYHMQEIFNTVFDGTPCSELSPLEYSELLEIFIGFLE